jgi:hypothetical protein
MMNQFSIHIRPPELLRNGVFTRSNVRNAKYQRTSFGGIIPVDSILVEIDVHFVVYEFSPIF